MSYIMMAYIITYNLTYYHYSLNRIYYHYPHFTEKEIEAQRLIFRSYTTSTHPDFQ